jgi:hypothetical protein
MRILLLIIILKLTISMYMRKLLIKNNNIIRKMSDTSIFSNLNLHLNRIPTNCYTDAHAHLIHEQFSGEEDSIVAKCQQFGLQHIIVNGLDPKSNRDVIDLCSKHHPTLLPAIGYVKPNIIKNY